MFLSERAVERHALHVNWDHVRLIEAQSGDG